MIFFLRLQAKIPNIANENAQWMYIIAWILSKALELKIRSKTEKVKTRCLILVCPIQMKLLKDWINKPMRFL